MKKLKFSNETELNVNESDFDLLLDLYEKVGDTYVLKSGMSSFEVSDSEWVDEAFLTAVGFEKTETGFEINLKTFKIWVNKEFSKMVVQTKVKMVSIPSKPKINEWISRLLFDLDELGFNSVEHTSYHSCYRKGTGLRLFNLSYEPEKRRLMLSEGATLLYSCFLNDPIGNRYLSVQNDLWELTKE